MINNDSITNRDRKKRRMVKMIYRIIFILIILLLFVLLIIGAFKGGKKLYNAIFYASSSKTIDSKELKIKEAKIMAKQYNYDKAIKTLKSIDDYKEDKKITKLIKKFKGDKLKCIPFPISKVEHVFYHSLVVDPTRAFEGPDSNENAGWKQWMVTVKEFNNITESMYKKGYVMVSLHDLVKEVKTDDGNTTFIENNDLMLPANKKAYVLSLDDTSYYHSYEGKGTASKLLINSKGKVTNEYIDANGNVKYGSYDCVPLIDDFVKKHPDASYHGHKGTLALTGYNGILGYRTDIAYKTRENLDGVQRVWLENHPDFNYEKECKQAKKVANAIKDNGWEFASHTWGHIKIGQVGMQNLIDDTTNWANYVEPLVGKTDIIVFAHGQDINPGKNYSENDEKFVYLKQNGFSFYCNVDSSDPYIYSIGTNYLRMGRMDLDGYRLWQDAYKGGTKTSNLFDAIKVIDPCRKDMPDL